MKNYEDVALILRFYKEEKEEETNEQYTAYELVDVALGEYTGKSTYTTEKFKDSNGKYYSRLHSRLDIRFMLKDQYEEGFAYVRRIDHMLKEYNCKDFEELRSVLLKEYKEKYESYVLGIYDNEYFLIGREFNGDNVVFYGLEINHKVKNNVKRELANNKPLNMELYSRISNKESKYIEDNKDNKNSKKQPSFNTHLLYGKIKETVKGQDEIIKEILTILWENSKLEKPNNLILVGSTGVGKTEIFRQLSKLIDTPLLITNVTGLTQAGYVGGNTEDILSNLLRLTNGDVKKAERAIVFLDEIDKIAYKGYDTGWISNIGVQYELLKIVEDGIFSVDYSRGKVTINTKNITFVGAGAFDGMINSKKEEIEDEDLIKFGLIPEFVGRMGKIIKLNDLDKTAIKEIITADKSAYKEKIRLINEENIKVRNALEESIIEEIANIAVSKKIGARAINGIVNKMFSNILFEISNPEEKYSELEITKATVSNPKKYVLRKENERIKRNRKINN